MKMFQIWAKNLI